VSDSEAGTSSPAQASQVLELIARSLVAEPDGVRVEVVEGSGRPQLNLHVADGDMGRIIGKRGRMAAAIRTVTRAAAARDVVVLLVTDRTERLEPGSALQTDRGELVVTASRRHQGRWLVTFEGVHDRNAAEQLRGLVLRAAPLDDPDALWVHELIGCTVVSADGVERGVVTSVLDNPAADLLVLDSGAMVPVVFVVGRPEGGVIRVDTPDGLFDLG
jgi:16S rRNA processing protein RimM